MTTQVTLDARKLARLLQPILPLASKDLALPILNGVLFESAGDYLTVTATDRYRIGVHRVKLDEPVEGLKAVVRVSALKSMLSIFKPTRYTNPVLALWFEQDRVQVVTQGLSDDLMGATLTYPLDIGEYPKTRSILGDLIKNADRASEVAVNAAFLADFKHAVSEGAALRVRVVDSARPLLITAGDDFVGALMPVRGETAQPFQTDKHWAGFFGGEL